MAYTIVRSAGKHATSGSPTLMATDSDHAASGGQRAQPDHTVPAVQIVRIFHDDPRLLIGVGAVASHTAQQADLSELVQEQLATAAVEACGEIFALAHPNHEPPPVVTLTASRFPDRIEIAVASSMILKSAEAGFHAKKAGTHDGTHAGKRLDGLVDEVQRETRDGRPSIVLVKYCRAVKSKA